MKRLFPTFACLLLLCLIAGCTSGPQKNGNTSNSSNTSNVSAAPPPPPDTGTVTTQPMTNTSGLPALIQKLKKSVVDVTYSGKHEPDDWNETDFAFVGSGVIYSVGNGKAYALTNRHVVDYNYPELSGKVDSENITIVTSSGQRFHASSRLVAPGLMDLAILVFDTGGENLSSVSLSNTAPQEGDDVLVIGMPEELNWSISKGIVSGVRTFTPLELDMGRNYTAIQTDAAVNPGNSGGGMFSMDGRLLGINAWKFGYFTEGLNFAVSVADFPALKSQFVQFPIATSGSQPPQGGTPAAIFGLTMGDYNYSTDGFSIAFVLMDSNWFPTYYAGPLRITLRDENGTVMLNRTYPANVADFRERPGYPFYGIRSYSVDVPLSSFIKSNAYYANLTVEATTSSGRLNSTEEIYLPYELSSDYSSSGDYYGDSGYYGPGSGSTTTPLKVIGVSSTNGGITVNLTGGGIQDDYGSSYYMANLTIANGNSDKADLEIYDATLVVDGKQYSADYTGDIGYVYPGASLDQEIDFTGVPSGAASATLYLTIDSYPSQDSYQSQELDYKLDFHP